MLISIMFKFLNKIVWLIIKFSFYNVFIFKFLVLERNDLILIDDNFIIKELKIEFCVIILIIFGVIFVGFYFFKGLIIYCWDVILRVIKL